MKKKQILSAVTALTLSIANCSNIFAADFPDVPANYWAKPYIDSAASLELMKGSSENGVMVFKPNAHVTYNESAQLIYNLLKKQDPSLTVTPEVLSRWSSTMQLYGIPNWVYEPLAYCLENNLITYSDLTKFMSNGTANVANREDVSVMFGKAMAKYYQLSSSVNLTFKDSASISASAKVYVELLSRLGIITGNESNYFNPTNNITRAEIATIINRAYNSLQSGIEVTPQPSVPTPSKLTGTVLSFTKVNNTTYSLAVRILDSSTEKSFLVNTSVPVYKNNNAASFSDITKDDIIYMVYTDASNISEITITKDIIPSTDIEGKIEYISSSYLKFKDNDNISSKYYFSNSYSLTLDGKNVKISTLQSKIEDKNVYAVITLDSNNKITSIVAKTSVDTYDEVVENVKIANITNNSKLKIKKSSVTYELANKGDIDINVQDGLVYIDEIDDLKEAVETNNAVIEADLYIYKDEVVKITGRITDIPGTLYSLSTKKEELKIKLGSEKYETYDFNDDMDISLDGRYITVEKFSSALSQADKDKKYILIELSFDEEGYVSEIYATTSSEELSASSTISGAIDTLTENYIKIDDNSTKYYFADKIDKIEITDGKLNDPINNLAALEKAIDSGKVFEIEITLTDSKVTQITGYITSTVGGEITDIKSSRKRIIIDNDFTYDYDEDVEIKLDKEGVTINEFKEAFDEMSNKDKMEIRSITFEDDYIISIDARIK